MINIQNTYNNAIVYADTLDSGAEGLIRALCGSPLSAGCTIRIMPDVHAGKGCAIGTTMTLTDKIAPGLVGVDIGCGLSVYKIRCKKLELQKLDKTVHQAIPAGRSVRAKAHRFAEQLDLDELCSGRHVQKDKALCSIGTLGGGNHFIELDKGQDGAFWLIIHSGSRKFGAEVAEFYQKEAYADMPDGIPYEFAYTTGALMQDYLHDMQITQKFAEINRQAMAAELIKAMKWDVEDYFSCIHNYIDTERMLLRKGAISAQAGERVLIPLNMRDGCLICLGKGNPGWNYSAPHGAGRLLSRAEAKQSFTLSQFKKEMAGVYSTSISKETLDESPMAYKPMQTILKQIEPTAEVKERIYPVYNFKAGEE
ncbi:MAG: RtcB family protein [bacterium]|nr:RtcB family protein [bacterium]